MTDIERVSIGWALWPRATKPPPPPPAKPLTYVRNGSYLLAYDDTEDAWEEVDQHWTSAHMGRGAANIDLLIWPAPLLSGNELGVAYDRPEHNNLGNWGDVGADSVASENHGSFFMHEGQVWANFEQVTVDGASDAANCALLDTDGNWIERHLLTSFQDFDDDNEPLSYPALDMERVVFMGSPYGSDLWRWGIYQYIIKSGDWGEPHDAEVIIDDAITDSSLDWVTDMWADPVNGKIWVAYNAIGQTVFRRYTWPDPWSGGATLEAQNTLSNSDLRVHAMWVLPDEGADGKIWIAGGNTSLGGDTVGLYDFDSGTLDLTATMLGAHQWGGSDKAIWRPQ